MNSLAAYTHFRPMFAEAMDPALHTIAELDAKVHNGALVLATNEAAIVAELHRYATGTLAVHGVIAAGELLDIRKVLIPQAETWGRMNGCKGAEIDSREAWGRVLKEDGYQVQRVRLWKEL